MRCVLVFTALTALSLMCGCSTPRIELAVASQSNVNPDHTGRPSPVIVKIYEMRSDLAFSHSDFRPLFESPVQILGSDLLAVDEMVLVPGEARRITYEPVQGTCFMGVLAGFRQLERARWRTVVPIDCEGENAVGIEISDATISLIPDDEVSGWDPAQAVRDFHNPTENAVKTGTDAPAAAKGATPSAAARPMGEKAPSPGRGRARFGPERMER